MRRWKETEKEENEGAWSEQVLEYLPRCVCSSPTSWEGETTAMTPAIPWEISATLLSLCVSPGRGWGMRSLRPGLRILTKGERRGHLFSMPGRQGTLQEAGDRILIYCLRWASSQGELQKLINIDTNSTKVVGGFLFPTLWGQGRLLGRIHFPGCSSHFSGFSPSSLQCLLENLILS